MASRPTPRRLCPSATDKVLCKLLSRSTQHTKVGVFGSYCLTSSANPRVIIFRDTGGRCELQQALPALPHSLAGCSPNGLCWAGAYHCNLTCQTFYPVFLAPLSFLGVHCIFQGFIHHYLRGLFVESDPIPCCLTSRAFLMQLSGSLHDPAAPVFCMWMMSRATAGLVGRWSL